MKTKFKIILFPLLSILLISSCGPMRYTVDVEKRVKPRYCVDFGEDFPGIVTLNRAGDRDSVYFSMIALGLAEKLEQDSRWEAGTIPVYAVTRGEFDFSDPKDVAYLHDLVGVNHLILMESLSVGDFLVRNLPEKAYYQEQYLYQTSVELGYKYLLKVCRKGQERPLHKVVVDENLDWLLYSESPGTKAKAVSSVLDRVEASFREAGADLGTNFTPQWKSEEKMLFVYNDARWTEAYDLAYSFRWKEAMEVWLKLIDYGNPRRSAYAAHNISVACEILELKDLSREWKEKYEEFIIR